MSDTEEKTLAPSEHKLRKSREKGQVSSSADFVTAMITISGIVIVYISASSYAGLFIDLFSRGIITMNGASDALLKLQLLFLSRNLISIIAPLALVLGLVAVLANVVHKKGIPFSMHPIKPDMSRISFTKGLKKLFATRNTVEFGVSMFRIILWFVTAMFIVWIWLPELISAPLCGVGCLVSTVSSLAQWLFIAGCILLIVFAIVDIPMQVALFKKDQKMGVSEQKRERRDTDGSPEIKQKRRQLAQEDAGQASKKTLTAAPGILLIGGGYVVDLRFKSGQTPLPVLLHKAQGDAAHDLLTQARLKNYPIEDLGDVVVEIYGSVGIGQPITQKHFSPVANALVKNGMV